MKHAGNFSRRSASLAILAIAVLVSDSPSGYSAQLKSASLQPQLAKESQSGRESSAIRLIRQAELFNQKAALLIAQTQAVTDQAKHLTGAANRYESTLTPKMKPLTGAKLASAKRMFKVDLEQFEQHAREYREHTQSAREQVGQCEASRRAYEANKQAYSLHCGDYHMPNIPPPHVCVVLGRTMEENVSAAAKVRDNMKRMIEAETILMQAEKRLDTAVKNSDSIDMDARKQNEINLREQNLVAEFGQLQEEYRQLGVERNVLKASGVKTVVPTVSAKLRRK